MPDETPPTVHCLVRFFLISPRNVGSINKINNYYDDEDDYSDDDDEMGVPDIK